MWFCHYPQPLRCITDIENEFLGTEHQELLSLYGVKPIHTTSKESKKIKEIKFLILHK
jgi:hypothetical protein